MFERVKFKLVHIYQVDRSDLPLDRQKKFCESLALALSRVSTAARRSIMQAKSLSYTELSQLEIQNGRIHSTLPSPPAALCRKCNARL